MFFFFFWFLSRDFLYRMISQEGNQRVTTGLYIIYITSSNSKSRLSCGNNHTSEECSINSHNPFVFTLCAQKTLKMANAVTLISKLINFVGLKLINKSPPTANLETYGVIRKVKYLLHGMWSTGYYCTECEVQGVTYCTECEVQGVIYCTETKK
jgi:hypothetical protein